MPETVYISSTFNDLKNYRQAIINCIISLNDYYKPVSMEFYDSEDVHFVKKCLDDVAACNIYILILGKRYGYIPKGFDKSITEMEYDKARELQTSGKPIQILVFKVGDLCNNYTYEETDPQFKQYQKTFLDELNERLSPKPFDSEAELALQVSHALMKRLFKLIKTGVKIIPPDKDAVLCYCDRTVQISGLKSNILLNKKKIFFVQGNRRKDSPGGVIKRFAKYSLGSTNKIEPLIKITDLFTSNDAESNYTNAFVGLLDYLNISLDSENVKAAGFLEALRLTKNTKIILPFYYDFDFDEDTGKFKEFLLFTNMLFEQYGKGAFDFQLYFVIVIYSEQPDYAAINTMISACSTINPLSACIDKLKPVTDNDIIDWLEKFVTTIDFSPTVFEKYFGADGKEQFTMQEVNVTLGKIIEDIGNGSETIKDYL